MDNKNKKKIWTYDERLELATKLDGQLDDFISQLEKRTFKDGYTEESMLEELENHPFFMKKAPEPGQPLSPLVEGLQQLKYSSEENTPEQLAKSYKDDGNFNFNNGQYRMSIISYTEGIRTKCKDQELLAQLYNNRATAHYMLQNYRCSLNDSKQAIKLKSDYAKSLERAARCCFRVKDFEQCNELCDKILRIFPEERAILDLKRQIILSDKTSYRDQRKQKKEAAKLSKEEEELLSTIKSRGIKLELLDGDKIPNLKDLESKIPELMQSKVHLDGNNKLVWPVIFLYPEFQETDFVQNFHEDITIKEQLEELYFSPPPWDIQHQYNPDTVAIYFEGKDKISLHKVDISETLGKILTDEQFLVRGGTPAFLIFVKDSKAEARYLRTYHKE
ncbi:DNA polymerase interacting tetratricopeptide repeat-containing, protein of 47 kDa [Vespa velutina]|uniref:DNA polymerase interacting tetratricopeptide repeat-containing, protein of 47 kDa n=1 Tax=Vespa velutina TaxID=202808 RepID=UPI001FB43551|nr:DNA polymerase interacting tetratricopeptide repeat-containing, protein of 47 kDa [Vespa velutina]